MDILTRSNIMDMCSSQCPLDIENRYTCESFSFFVVVRYVYLVSTPLRFVSLIISIYLWLLQTQEINSTAREKKTLESKTFFPPYRNKYVCALLLAEYGRWKMYTNKKCIYEILMQKYV